MDEKPQLRFAEITKHYKDDIVPLIKTFCADFPYPMVLFFEYTNWIWQFTQYERYMEIYSIHNYIKDDLTLGQLFAFNTLYEISSYCSSIVARMKDGTIIHGRNLDFYHPELLKKVTYNVKFVRGEEYVYDAVMFAGLMGVYSG